MTPNNSVNTLIIERIFDAPREIVWKAFTEPEQMMRWWGPRAFTCPVCKIDFRVGGRYHSCMSGVMPDGIKADIWSTGVYQEIIPIEKIVCTDSFADSEGNVVPASYYGMTGEFPLEMQVIFSFEDLGGKTKMTLHHVGMPEYMSSDANHGWYESFDKLAESLAANSEVTQSGT